MSQSDEPTHSQPSPPPESNSEPENSADRSAQEEDISTPETIKKIIATPWSRRRLLGGAVGGFASWVLVACGGTPTTPTPTPTKTRAVGAASRSILARPTNTPLAKSQTYLPIANAYSTEDAATVEATQAEATQVEAEQVEAAQLATDTPEPTDTLEPTNTPESTNTPSPTQVPPTSIPIPPTEGTPFPPGPPSKLGLHVERNIPAIFDLLETGGVATITTLELDANFAAQIKQTSPATKLIGRIVLPQVQLSQLTDPAGSARAFVEQLLPYADDTRRRDSFDAWISHNEPNPGNVEEMKRLSEFEAERVRLLGERGIRSVIGNFATGGPDLPLWEHFLPAVQSAQQHNGWLGLHEYSAPTIYYLSTRADQGRYPGVSLQDDGWLTLRYRKVYNEFLFPAGLGIPLVFTECGVDGLVQANRPGPAKAGGWQDFQQYWAENGYGLWGPGAYIEQLVWFDKAMQQDWYVLGGCVYALGTSSRWLSYDLDGPAAEILKQYLSVHVST